MLYSFLLISFLEKIGIPNKKALAIVLTVKLIILTILYNYFFHSFKDTVVRILISFVFVSFFLLETYFLRKRKTS